MGTTFTVNVNLSGGQNVYSVPLQILYNPNVLQLVNVSNGPLLSAGRAGGSTRPSRRQHDGDPATHSFASTGKRGISGDGQIFTLTFPGKAPGQATLSINRAMLKNASMQNIPVGGSQAIITVH